MGKLRPIGSEKLEGNEKINRILEIARYKENIPQPVNETISENYQITLSDGFTYKILKERNGYVIKKSITEGTEDYLEPMKNRKYYPSYSQALKRLNLIIKEVNTILGNDEETSLFGEQKKYTLKTPKPAMDAPVAEPLPNPLPTQEVPSDMPPTNMGNEEPMSDMGGEEPIGDVGTEEPMADMGGEEPIANMDGDIDGEEVTMKTIQKLTGKLGQKIRQFSQDQPLSSNDAKYVINSILSAIDLSTIEPEDKEEILSRIEGEDSDMGSENMDMGDEDLGMDQMTEPEPPSQEMTEMDMPEMDEEINMKDVTGGYGKMVGNAFSNKLKEKMSSSSPEMEESEYMEGLHKIMDSVFSESKVEKIISNYFKIDEREKKLMESKKTNFNFEKVRNICETFKQETSSKKVIDKYPNAVLLGKTTKKNLVFKINETQIKITPEGKIL